MLLTRVITAFWQAFLGCLIAESASVPFLVSRVSIALSKHTFARLTDLGMRLYIFSDRRFQRWHAAYLLRFHPDCFVYWNQSGAPAADIFDPSSMMQVAPVWPHSPSKRATEMYVPVDLSLGAWLTRLAHWAVDDRSVGCNVSAIVLIALWWMSLVSPMLVLCGVAAMWLLYRRPIVQ